MFVKGVSGNPLGKPKGTKNKATKFAKALDDFNPEDVSKLLRKLLELGKDGDVAATKIFLDHTLVKADKRVELEMKSNEEDYQVINANEIFRNASKETLEELRKTMVKYPDNNNE